MPIATSAHPLYDRDLHGSDLEAMPNGGQVRDCFAIQWTKRTVGNHLERWYSVVDPDVGVDSYTLMLAEPIKRCRTGGTT